MPGYEVIDNEERKEVDKIFKDGGVLFRHSFNHLRNNSYKVDEFEKKFALKMGSKYALAVTSGTAALRVALATLKLKPGDEVITQSFTFVATVEAIIESRATPVCTEINDTLNMDPSDLIKKISSKTKAVIVVHMLGVPAEIGKIKKICKKNNLILIEDTAWGCGGKINKKYLGTIGDIGTYSFDFAKTITTGEGGMILFKNKKSYEYANAWHDHGHENNPRVPRWEDTRKSSGFNYRMTEMQAAVGIVQLKKLDNIIKMQRENRSKIFNEIKDLDGIDFRKMPNFSFDSADALIFFTENKLKALKCRNSLIKSGLTTKILPEATTWHFAKEWTHMPELKQIKNKNAFNSSKRLLDRSVSIPINVNMQNKIPKKIKTAIEGILKKS